MRMILRATIIHTNCLLFILIAFVVVKRMLVGGTTRLSMRNPGRTV